MPDNVHDGTPLTYVDTAWLHMEDPTNLMMVTGIFIFDRPLDFARVRDTLQGRMADRFPRLRHRVKQDGSSAHWVEDPTFDMDAHVHKMALPAPGDLGALRDVVSDLMSTPLDFSKPLWQCHYIEGLGSGSAILLRFHHCIGDGVALVHVILSLTDTAADAPWPKRTKLMAHEEHVGERIVSLIDGARSAVERTVGTTRKVTGALLQEGVEALLHPSHVLDMAQTTTEAAAILVKLLLKSADPATLFKGHLGVAKRAAWSRPIRLDEVKAVGKTVGGTVNDVLLTAVSGALRRYLLLRGDRVDGVEINAMVPVNLRPLSEADQLGNRFGLIYLALPVGTGDRAERLRLVKARMDEIKSSPQPFVTFQILNALGLAPVEVADLAVRHVRNEGDGRDDQRDRAEATRLLRRREGPHMAGLGAPVGPDGPGSLDLQLRRAGRRRRRERQGARPRPGVDRDRLRGGVRGARRVGRAQEKGGPAESETEQEAEDRSALSVPRSRIGSLLGQTHGSGTKGDKTISGAKKKCGGYAPRKGR